MPRNMRVRKKARLYGKPSIRSIALIEAELHENPYDPRALGHLRDLYKATGQPDKAREMVKKIDHIQRCITNHTWENLPFSDVRQPFNDQIAAGNFTHAAELLVRLCRDPSRDFREINTLLSDADRINADSSNQFISTLSPSEVSFDIGVLCALGLVHLHAGHKVVAGNIFQQAQYLNPNSITVEQAKLSLTTDDSFFLLRRARNLRRKDPENIEYAQTLAAGYLRHNLVDKALGVLLPLEAKPHDWRFTHLLALTYLKANNVRMATTVLDNAPESTLERVRLARAFISRDDERAAAVASKIIQNEFDPLAMAVFAIASNAGNQWFSTAQETTNPFIALIPEDQALAVRDTITRLHANRSFVVESLIAETWDAAKIGNTRIRTSTISADNTLRPVNTAAVRDIYKPHKLDC